MKNKIALLLIALPVFIFGQEEETLSNQNIADFVSAWKIDLRPSPDAEGYYQPFNVEAIDGNSFSGTFYGSPIENGLLNNNWDKLYFAFTTKDSSNAYYHSGYLVDGKMEGISYCPTRDFTAPWVAEKN